MLEETRKKLYLWGLIALAVSGGLFVLFAIFLNRGTLTVVAQAPFSLEISGVRSQTCVDSPCSTVLAPGDYTIILKKAGYSDVTREINVPILGEHTEEVEFQFVPAIRELGPEEELQLFTEPQIENESLSDLTLFYEDQYVTYLAPDPETGRQTLYYRALSRDPSDSQGLKLGEETVATSFTRNLTTYKIVPAIADQQKIAVIDASSTPGSDAAESTLYIVDLELKERNNALTLPAIFDLKWIPGTSNLLLEVRNLAPNRTIAYFDYQNDKLTYLGLNTDLTNVAIQDPQTFIAATAQSPAFNREITSPEFSSLTETEFIADPNTSQLIPVTFARFTLMEDFPYILVRETFPGIPQKARMHPENGSFIFLINGTDYELTLGQ